MRSPLVLAVALVLAPAECFTAAGTGAAITGRSQVQRRGPKLAMGFLENIFGPPPSAEIDYGALTGLPDSAALEAGKHALAGAVPAKSEDGYAIATFAGGCFWGIELAYQRVPGVIATCVGYTQGETSKPTYKEVSTGSTGHTEALQVFYDPKAVDFEALVLLLQSRINPTEINRSGADVGTQYRSGIYCHTDEQLTKAEKWRMDARASGRYKGEIVTEVKRAGLFWPAEEYHQQYLVKGGRMGRAQSAAKGCEEEIRCYG